MKEACGTSSCLSEWKGFQVCDCEGGLLRPALRFLVPPSTRVHAYSGTPACPPSIPQTFFLPEAARGWDLVGLKGCGILFLHKPNCQEEKGGELEGHFLLLDV